jgi:hypothetical protein
MSVLYIVSHAFKVVNPQKSFTVCAPSAKAKLAWIEAIHLALKAVRAQRKKFMAGTSGDDSLQSLTNVNANGNGNGGTDKKTPSSRSGHNNDSKLSPVDPRNPLAYAHYPHST